MFGVDDTGVCFDCQAKARRPVFTIADHEAHKRRAAIEARRQEIRVVNRSYRQRIENEQRRTIMPSPYDEFIGGEMVSGGEPVYSRGFNRDVRLSQGGMTVEEFETLRRSRLAHEMDEDNRRRRQEHYGFHKPMPTAFRCGKCRQYISRERFQSHGACERCGGRPKVAPARQCPEGVDPDIFARFSRLELD